MYYEFYRLLKDIERLKRLLRKSQGMPIRDADLRDYVYSCIDTTDRSVLELISLLESCRTLEDSVFRSLNDLLESYNREFITLREGISGYTFPLAGKRNAEVFIAYSRNHAHVAEDRITIESDTETLAELCKRADNGDLLRRIYLPDGNGGYVLQGDYVLDVQKSKDANAESWISLVVLQNGGWQRYDKMFIIDSLKVDKDGNMIEDNTAIDLENQILEYHHLGKGFCQRIKVTSLKEWENAMHTIIQSARHNCVPIVHLEMHGDDEGNLIVNDNAVVPVAVFLARMQEVSIRCNAKTLITLAVCNGLTYYQKMAKSFNQLPCGYVVGSCQVLQSGNIAKRFGAFYKELLQDSTTKVDIRRAFTKMMDVHNANKFDKEYYKDEKFVMVTEGEAYDEDNYKSLNRASK